MADLDFCYTLDDFACGSNDYSESNIDPVDVYKLGNGFIWYEFDKEMNNDSYILVYGNSSILNVTDFKWGKK